MAIKISTAMDLARLLDEEGFPLPQECREARLIMGVDSAIMIQYDIFVTAENMVKLGKALQRLGDVYPIRDRQ